MKQLNVNVFDRESKIEIGNQVYIVERHFEKNRDMEAAIYEVVKNAVKARNLFEKDE